MACSCQGTPAAGLWVNVKADGTPTKPMTKTEALDSQTRNGGYIRAA